MIRVCTNVFKPQPQAGAFHTFLTDLYRVIGIVRIPENRIVMI